MHLKNTEQINSKYQIICLEDASLYYNAKQYNDIKYYCRLYNSFDSALNSIHFMCNCKCVYTAIGLFKNKENITQKYIKNMRHYVPFGNKKIEIK